MSAFITDKAHIDAMITVARLGPEDAKDNEPGEYWPAGMSADQLGEMLTAEMIASVSYRYPEDNYPAPEAELPGPVEQWYREPYRYEPTRRLTVAEAHKAVCCYVYQSCEHPGWRSSAAFTFCERFRAWLLSQ